MLVSPRHQIYKTLYSIKFQQPEDLKGLWARCNYKPTGPWYSGSLRCHAASVVTRHVYNIRRGWSHSDLGNRKGRSSDLLEHTTRDRSHGKLSPNITWVRMYSNTWKTRICFSGSLMGPEHSTGISLLHTLVLEQMDFSINRWKLKK